MRHIKMKLSSGEEVAIQALSKLSGDKNTIEFFRSAGNFYAWYLMNIVEGGARLLISRDGDDTVASEVHLLTRGDLLEAAQIQKAKRQESELTDE